MRLERFILVITVFFAAFSVSAQQEFSFGLTYSQPVGKYASNSLQEGGFADPGWGLYLDSKTAQASWPFGLQLGLHFSYQEHQFSQRELTNAFDNFFKQQIGNEYSTLISVGYYKPLIMTLGPYYDLYLSEKLTLNIKTGIGVLFVNMDTMKFNILDQNNDVIAQETLHFEGNAVFTYFVGGVISYSLSEDWSLGISVDHSGGKSEITTSFSRDNKINAVQKVAFINLGMQLSYQF